MGEMKLHDNWIFKRGDVYIANLNPRKGSEQGGIRPVLVLQNDAGNFYCPTLIVAPLTSRLKKLELPVHYLLSEKPFLTEESMVELEQIKTIDKLRIKFYLGKIDKTEMKQIDEVIATSLGLFISEAVEAP